MIPIDEAYGILGIDADASDSVVEKAYRLKKQQYEADPGEDPWEFEQVQKAFQIIRQSRSNSPAIRLPAKPVADEQEATGMPTHLVWQAFFRQLPLQNETTWFLLFNVLDIVMTVALLQFNPNSFESNPIANYFYRRWGFDGMIFWKLVTAAVVCLLAQLIARRDLVAARRLLIAGTIIVGAVVVYSATLLAGGLR